MHIIIGVLTAAAGLIWALYRLQSSGVDLNSFNPFYWMRRKKWEKQLSSKPMHQLEDPIEAAALLVVAIAIYKTGVTRELRNEVTALFEKEFEVTSARALELFSASLHMLHAAGSVENEVRHILAPAKPKLNPTQIASLLDMLKKAVAFEPVAIDEKEIILKSVEKELAPQIRNPSSKW